MLQCLIKHQKIFLKSLLPSRLVSQAFFTAKKNYNLREVLPSTRWVIIGWQANKSSIKNGSKCGLLHVLQPRIRSWGDQSTRHGFGHMMLCLLQEILITDWDEGLQKVPKKVIFLSSWNKEEQINKCKCFKMSLIQNIWVFMYTYLNFSLSITLCDWICLKDQPHASAFVSKIKWNQECQQCCVCTVNTFTFSCTNTSHTNQHREAQNRPKAATVDPQSKCRGYKSHSFWKWVMIPSPFTHYWSISMDLCRC